MSSEWDNYDQLRKSIAKQNMNLDSQRGSFHFDPHKYFGGWDWAERSSIEQLKLDKRLLEMMEYDSNSSSSLSKSNSLSIISESQVWHNVAEELVPSSTKPKKNKLFDFKIKTPHYENKNNIKKINDLKYKSKLLNKAIAHKN